MPPGAPPHSSWNVYFGVTDVDAATRRARPLGAQVLAEPFDVAEHGRMSMLIDPTGAPMQRLCCAVVRHGAPVAVPIPQDVRDAQFRQTRLPRP